eukprot:TRINITY_DN12526_c0_g2_i1.p1 TRINITY_DN12526_c0_g2~~TRINITY_DN12526_c0_g2_i1.p1  ORF type:complete len:162 (-),score=22.90 TRINITY_DN12526_c0_g2_i1:20-505(-)
MAIVPELQSLLSDIYTNVSPVFLLFLIGFLSCFFGHRKQRVFSFLFGFAAGGAAVFSFFVAQTELERAGVPQILGLLGAMVGGVLALLLPLVTLGVTLGYVLAAILMAVDNNGVFVSFTSHVLCYGTLIAISLAASFAYQEQIGRAVQQECRDRSRMPSSA